MRPMITRAATMALIALTVPFVISGAATAEQSSALERQVKEAMRGRDLRRVEVSVEGNEATLSGQVPHFWAKDQAIKRALEVEGIETVASELELPEPENDDDLAEEVAKAVQGYVHYTMWDNITGSVNEGNVFLGGWVTPDRNKAGELFERVAKITGVQDVQNEIKALPPSQGDRRLRNAFLRQLARNSMFDRLVNMRHPPFHILVHNGIVTLLGYVQTQAEVITMQRIIGQTQGVLRVDNQLETLQ